MKKTTNEEEFGFFEEFFFDHIWSEDTEMFERDGVRTEAIWFTGLIIFVILFML